MASAVEGVTTEIMEVKSVLPNRCRVTKNVDGFSQVVTIQPKDMDITIKFQLTEFYPSTIPEIVIRSESLSSTHSSELKDYLNEKANQLIHKPMLLALLEEAEKWLHEHDIHPGKTVEVYADKTLIKPTRKKKKSKIKHDEEEAEVKKPPMKTAEDVIKRILWDVNLSKDDFLVGYLDRFLGIVEKYFSAFSWEDISTVDYTVLAVPKHRIQYFKYRNQTIWDKQTRKDDVFGSTGSGITVYDVMQNYTDNQEDLCKSETERKELTTDPETDEGNSDSDESIDDGIRVTIGNYAKSLQEDQDSMDNKSLFDQESVPAYDPYWQDKLRPNYFLAIRIMDKEILQTVENMQDYLLDNEPLYGACCIPPSALHITLCTLGLDTPQQVLHATQILKKIEPELSQFLPKEPLTIQGVSHFYNRVLYGKVIYQSDFVSFVDHLKMLVIEAGLEIRDSHDFIPHMTIMKVTRPVARQKGNKSIDSWLYHSFTDVNFGRQKVDAIYLCSMGDDRRDDGFYVCPCEIHFDHN